MAETQEPLLSLQTFCEHKQVAIDGTLYNLVNPGELSILDYHRISKRGQRAQELMDKNAELTDAEVRELTELLDSLCRMILDAPDELHGRLRDTHRLQVVTVFCDLQRDQMSPRPAGGEEAEESPTGVS